MDAFVVAPLCLRTDRMYLLIPKVLRLLILVTAVIRDETGLGHYWNKDWERDRSARPAKD